MIPVNETVIRDMIEIIKDGIRKNDDYDDLVVWGRGSKHSFRSITKASSDLVLTFPVLISDTVEVETAVMISKSHERKCAALMHMLFSALSVSSDSENVYDYLKQFHKNLDFGQNDLSVDYFNDTMDDIADKYVDEGFYDDRRFKEWKLKTIQESLKRMSDKYNISNDIINEISVDDYRIARYKGKNGSVVLLNPINEGILNNRNSAQRWLERRHQGVSYGKFTDREVLDLARTEYDQDRTDAMNRATERNQQSARELAHQREINRLTNQLNGRGSYNRDEPHWTKQYSDTQTGMEKASGRLKNPFVQTDVNKANELLPTMLVVNFYSPAANTPVTAVIGIKAKLYRVSGQEIINRLLIRNKDNQGFHNFLRAATRETAFFKDFVFAIDKAKIDALSSSHRGSDSKIWRLLERRAIKSRIRKSMGMYNDATAITTLCITQDEVESLKKDHQLDITRPPVLKPIMEAYNLMGFVIIDPNIEACKFWYDDGSNSFETLSFRSLEREGQDQNYKKVINLMTKMVR